MGLGGCIATRSAAPPLPSEISCSKRSTIFWLRGMRELFFASIKMGRPNERIRLGEASAKSAPKSGVGAREIGKLASRKARSTRCSNWRDADSESPVRNLSNSDSSFRQRWLPTGFFWVLRLVS